MKQIPFIVKENFLSNEELSQVATETKSIIPKLRDGRHSRFATKNGNILKKNSGVHYSDLYDNHNIESQTCAIFNRKVFQEKLYSTFDNQVLADLSQTVDWNGMMMSYYKHGDYYKPHFDGSFITGLYWFHLRTPKKFTGGELLLYNATKSDTADTVIPFQPVHNRFMAFPSCYMHEVKEVFVPPDYRDQMYGRFCISVFCGHKST